MIRLIKKSLYFTLFYIFFFSIINFIFLVLIASTDWDWKKRLESLRFKDPDFDLLVLGSSLPEHGIDTDYLTKQGIKSYNLALVGNTIKSCYIQLNEYLYKYSKKPKYVLLAINSTLEPVDGEKIQGIVEYTMKGYRFSLQDFPLLRFSKWFGGEFLKKILSRNHRKAKVFSGQIKRYKTTPDISDYNKIFLDKLKIESSYWISELAKLCYQNEIEMIIIEIPGFREVQNLSEIGPHKLFLKNGYSVSLYNFNSQNFCTIFNPRTDWIGVSHLNPNGARKFSQVLVKILNNQPLNWN